MAQRAHARLSWQGSYDPALKKRRTVCFLPLERRGKADPAAHPRFMAVGESQGGNQQPGAVLYRAGCALLGRRKDTQGLSRKDNGCG